MAIKKKKEDISYKELNEDELSDRIDKAQEDIFKLRFRASTAQLKNPMAIQQLRREVARLNTFLTMRRKSV